MRSASHVLFAERSEAGWRAAEVWFNLTSSGEEKSRTKERRERNQQKHQSVYKCCSSGDTDDESHFIFENINVSPRYQGLRLHT